MLLSNAHRPDPRVGREAQALADRGYRVTVVCWDREADLPAREQHGRIDIVRVHSVRSAYGSGSRQLLYLPRFWRRAIDLAAGLNPDVVHCHDLDTLYAGWRLRRRLGCPLIYDAHEHYPAWASLYLPAPFVTALRWWEQWLLRRVNATITASTVLRDEFSAKGVSPVIALGNYQDVGPYAAVPDDEIAALRSRLGVSPNDLLVAYISSFARNRVLLPLIEAAAALPDVCFHLWGDGLQRTEIEQAAASRPNVTYHGWLAEDALPLHFRAADIVYYALLTDYPGAIYNAPNTLAQAMAAGRPVICNDVGDLGRTVGETHCGVLLGETTPAAIVAAVESLRDPALRARLGNNGRRAAETTYNAAINAGRLCELYDSLFD
jgi:glycosyltransferase involved in cell wall biosynthesis